MSETISLRGLLRDIDRLNDQPNGGIVRIDREHTLTVKRPTRALWPTLGLTTVDLMRYYVEISSFLLPHIKDRPLSFRRLDKSVEGASQFHQRIKWPTPQGVRMATFPAEGRVFESRLIGGDLTTLLYCANLAIISQDVWLSTVHRPDSPDYAVFDLDPVSDVPFRKVVDVARWLHEVLDEHGVPHGVKTSGMSGLHIYVPVINADYRSTRALVTQFAAHVAGGCPDVATIAREIKKRGRRVYLDPDQNMRAKTMAAPYSVRHSAFAGVSAPVTWAELDAGVRPEDCTIFTIRDRIRRIGDLWQSLHRTPFDLGRLLSPAA